MGRTAEVRVPWGSLQVTVSEPIEETADGKRAGHDASLVGVQVALDGPEDLLVARPAARTARCRTRPSRSSPTRRSMSSKG